MLLGEVAVKRIVEDLLQLGLVIGLEQWLGAVIDLGRATVENDLACELALPFVEVLLFAEGRNRDDISRDKTWSCRRPRSGLCDEDGRIGLRHVGRGCDLTPSHAEVAPTLETRIRTAHG